MGIFGLLKDVVMTPVDIARDIVTLGGELTDGESAIKKRVDSIEKNLEETYDQ